jgi:hypothetical protein
MAQILFQYINIAKRNSGYISGLYFALHTQTAMLQTLQKAHDLQENRLRR